MYGVGASGCWVVGSVYGAERLCVWLDVFVIGCLANTNTLHNVAQISACSVGVGPGGVFKYVSLYRFNMFCLKARRTWNFHTNSHNLEQHCKIQPKHI